MNYEKEAIVLYDEHLIIRETVGYDLISEISYEDIPVVMNFLQIVFNYIKMDNILKESKQKKFTILKRLVNGFS